MGSSGRVGSLEATSSHQHYCTRETLWTAAEWAMGLGCNAKTCCATSSSSCEMSESRFLKLLFLVRK
eukprot:5482356-Amphidinium_carterae.1